MTMLRILIDSCTDDSSQRSFEILTSLRLAPLQIAARVRLLVWATAAAPKDARASAHHFLALVAALILFVVVVVAAR